MRRALESFAHVVRAAALSLSECHGAEQCAGYLHSLINEIVHVVCEGNVSVHMPRPGASFHANVDLLRKAECLSDVMDAWTVSACERTQGTLVARIADQAPKLIGATLVHDPASAAHVARALRLSPTVFDILYSAHKTTHRRDCPRPVQTRLSLAFDGMK